MKKITLLTIAVIILFVLNAVVIGSVFFGRQARDDRRPEPREVIIDKLHFNKGQIQQYEEKIDWHQKQIRHLDNNIRLAKEQLYNLLKKDGSRKEKDSLINLLAVYHRQVEEVHLKHFEDIKSICRPDQQHYFNELVNELPRLFGGMEGHPPRRPPGRQ